MRTDFDWPQVERGTGVWDWSKYDTIVSDAEKAGLKILPILGCNHPVHGRACDNLEAWGLFVRNFARRYAGRIKAAEVWNEPNSPSFWTGEPSPEEYYRVLERAFREIKAIDSSMIVASCGFAGTPFPYIERLYELGGGKCFDVMNVHPYCDGVRRDPEPELGSRLKTLRNLMTRFGDAGKPIWITEVGWATHLDEIDPVAGLTDEGLKTVNAAKTDWRKLFVTTPSRTLRASELAREIERQKPDVIFLPPDESYDPAMVPILLDFIRRGGVLVDYGGVPFQIPTGTSTKRERSQFRINFTAWWRDHELPKTITPTSDSRPQDVRFFTSDLLKPGDSFIPLREFVSGKKRAAWAGVYSFGSDLKGAIIVCGLVRKHSSTGVSEERQADYLERSLLLSLTCGVEKFFWYEFADRSNRPNASFGRQDRFGLVHTDLTGKPSYARLKKISRAIRTVSAPRIQFPSEGDVLPLLNECQRQYFRTPLAERKINFDDRGKRAALAKVTGWKPKSVRIVWTNSVPLLSRVEIRRIDSDEIVYSAVVTSNEVSVSNLEIARDYVCSISTVSGTSRRRFATEDLAPRLLDAGNVVNARDLGGRMTRFGRRIRQGKIFRTAAFNAKSVRTIVTNATGIVTNWIPGKIQVDADDVGFWVDQMKVRTDLDFRGGDECRGMTGSPLGPRVKWVNIASGSYHWIDQTELTRTNFARTFRVFLETNNYPIAMHCVSGQDRTGTVAYLLNALLGVDEEELSRDWETTAFWNPYAGHFNYKKRYAKLAKHFARKPGRNITEKVEGFVRSLGFTQDEIEKFRDIMLEPDK